MQSRPTSVDSSRLDMSDEGVRRHSVGRHDHTQADFRRIPSTLSTIDEVLATLELANECYVVTGAKVYDEDVRRYVENSMTGEW